MYFVSVKAVGFVFFAPSKNKGRDCYKLYIFIIGDYFISIYIIFNFYQKL